MTNSAASRGVGLRGRVTEEGFVVSNVENPAVNGLEKGDVILSIMGYPVCTDAIWERLVSGDNQYLRLGILDHRTRERVTRYCRLSDVRKNKAR